MDIADATLGRAGLTLTFTLFLIFVVWVDTYPFLDSDNPIAKVIWHPQWPLLACGIWGLFFIGGLMCFTLYHLYPYL